MLAGGTESMSMVPMMGHKPAINPRVFEDADVAIAFGMGITAEKVAERWKISREDQDLFALASHAKALTAQRGRRVLPPRSRLIPCASAFPRARRCESSSAR